MAKNLPYFFISRGKNKKKQKLVKWSAALTTYSRSTERREENEKGKMTSQKNQVSASFGL
jgi:hypothetical protein